MSNGDQSVKPAHLFGDELAAIYQHLTDGVALHEVIFDGDRPADYRILDVNPAFEVHTGLRRDDVIGRLASDVFGTDSAPYLGVYSSVARSGQTHAFEAYFSPMNRRFRVVAVPIGPRRFATVFRDITAVWKRDEALKRSEADLLRSQRVARLGSYHMDVRQGTWDCTPVLDELFGTEENPSHRLDEWIALLHPEDRESMTRYFIEEVVGHKRQFDREYRIVRRSDGRTIWVHGRGELEITPAGDVVTMFGTIQDVTERRLAEDAVVRSREQLLSVSELAHIGHFGMDLDRSDVSWTDEMFRIYGREPRSFRPTRRDMMDWVVPEDRDAVMAAMFEAAQQATSRRLEFRATRPDGQVRHCLVVVEGEGAGESGRLPVHGMIWDLTELRRAEEERRKLELQVMQTQKLESLGVLAGGIAHDFNNLLTTILGNVDLAMCELSPTSAERGFLSDIERASRRAADLCRQMLAYSGKGRFIVQPLSLNELVEEMTHLLSVSISKKAIINYNLAHGLSAVMADATQLRQVVMNLITNASEAIGDQSGVISLTTGAMDCDDAYLKGLESGGGSLPAGRYVYLEVGDTGHGMDRETMARIFDPFFTTKFTGRGLGLAAVQGIVRGHKGGLRVYSEAGKGTTFKVLLPAESRPAETLSAKAAADGTWQGHGLVLLADDEAPIRNMGRLMLERAGFQAITAADGREALELFRERQHDLRLVVLDLTMPYLDGEACFREMRRLAPEVKVIMTSGYNEQDVISRFVGKGLAGFVQKPYTSGDLIPKVRAALGE
jgi:PAS domain S-box-containing protein